MSSKLTSVDAGLHAGFHAQIDNALDFTVEDVARGTETRDAIAHHAAQQFVVITDGAAVAFEGQLIGGSQAGGTAADDGNFLAAGLHASGTLERQLVLDGIVAKEMFDGVDADVIFNLVAVAAGFARRRTDAAHHRREGVGLGDATEAVFLPVHPCRRLLDAAHDVEVAANVFTCRAGSLARRRGQHVLRTLMGVVSVKNPVAALAVLAGFAVLELAEGKTFFHVIGSGRHCCSPKKFPVCFNSYSSPAAAASDSASSASSSTGPAPRPGSSMAVATSWWTPPTISIL